MGPCRDSSRVGAPFGVFCRSQSELWLAHQSVTSAMVPGFEAKSDETGGKFPRRDADLLWRVNRELFQPVSLIVIMNCKRDSLCDGCTYLQQIP